MYRGRENNTRGAGGLAGPSHQPPNRDNEDEDFFNDVPMALAMPDDRELNLFEDDAAETPLEQLTRHWLNERFAPDLLPAQEALLTNLLDHLRRQVRCAVFCAMGCWAHWFGWLRPLICAWWLVGRGAAAARGPVVV
jgi:hypothetical protein